MRKSDGANQGNAVVRYLIRRGWMHYQDAKPLPSPRAFWRDWAIAVGFAVVILTIGVNQIWLSNQGFVSHPLQYFASFVCLAVGGAILLFTMYFALVYLNGRHRQEKRNRKADKGGNDR